MSSWQLSVAHGIRVCCGVGPNLLHFNGKLKIYGNTYLKLQHKKIIVYRLDRMKLMREVQCHEMTMRLILSARHMLFLYSTRQHAVSLAQLCDREKASATNNCISLQFQECVMTSYGT